MISGSTSRRFSAGMAIVNMLLRPITAFFLYKMVSERQNLYGSGFQDSQLGEIFSGGNNRRGRYQDMGPPPAQELSAPAAAEVSTLQKLQKV